MISQFLKFNRQCPLCDEPLHLYMRWMNSLFFKGKSIGVDTYQFYVQSSKSDNTDAHDSAENQALKKEGMLLTDVNGQILTEFTADNLANESRKHHIYFFFLCNPAGIKNKPWGDFEISLYKGCYYRSTPFYQFTKDEGGAWALDVVNPDHKEIINKDESLAFNSINDDLEKVYMMNLDYEHQKTALWHYAVSESQKKEAGFRPKLFEKDIPLLSTRPKLHLKDRDKLIERFDSWILMS